MNQESRESNQQIVRDILAELKSRGHYGFTLRPWNVYEPDTTMWWLVPSTKWPAYKYGKIALFRDEEKLNIGVHFEKGLSLSAGLMFSPKGAAKFCTGEDWIWHTVMADLKSGDFGTRINRISQAVGKSFRIMIQSFYVASDYETYAEALEGEETENKVSLLFENGRLADHPAGAKGELRFINKINTLPDLAALVESKEMEWFWIDLYAVIEVDEENIDSLKDYAVLFVEEFRELLEGK